MRRLLIALPFIACSGDDGTSPPADATVDSAGPGPATCLVPASFGALGTRTGMTGTAGPRSWSVRLDPAGTSPYDTFFIRLGANVAPGTFELTGTNVDYASCEVCVNIIADIVPMQGPSKFYFATGGTVTLTSVQPPAGTVTNVTYTEVTSGGAPTGTGCATRIDSLTFD